VSNAVIAGHGIAANGIIRTYGTVCYQTVRVTTSVHSSLKEQILHYLKQQKYSNGDLLGHIKEPIRTPSEVPKLGHLRLPLFSYWLGNESSALDRGWKVQQI